MMAEPNKYLSEGFLEERRAIEKWTFDTYSRDSHAQCVWNAEKTPPTWSHVNFFYCKTSLHVFMDSTSPAHKTWSSIVILCTKTKQRESRKKLKSWTTAINIIRALIFQSIEFVLFALFSPRRPHLSSSRLKLNPSNPLCSIPDSEHNTTTWNIELQTHKNIEHTRIDKNHFSSFAVSPVWF